MQALVFGVDAGFVPPEATGDNPLLVNLASTPMALQEVPDPPVRGDDWLVLQTRLTGICGSDSKQVFMDWGDVQTPDNPMKAFFSLPQVLGHEVVADVTAPGPEAEGLEVGDRVVLNPWPPCAPRGAGPVSPACALSMTPSSEMTTKTEDPARKMHDVRICLWGSPVSLPSVSTLPNFSHLISSGCAGPSPGIVSALAPFRIRSCINRVPGLTTGSGDDGGDAVHPHPALEREFIPGFGNHFHDIRFMWTHLFMAHQTEDVVVRIHFSAPAILRLHGFRLSL